MLGVNLQLVLRGSIVSRIQEYSMLSWLDDSLLPLYMYSVIKWIEKGVDMVCGSDTIVARRTI